MIKPKPFIEFLEWNQLAESDRPKFGTCERHGDFEINPVEVLDRVMGCTNVCPECSKEYKDYCHKEEEKAKQKRDEEFAVMMFEKKLRNYGVSPRHYYKTFDKYRVKTKEQKHALETCRYVAQKVTEGISKNVIMVGSVGVGKTHLASSMCHFLAEYGDEYDVKMSTVTEIIRYYRSSYSNDNELTEDEVIRSLTNKDLLIIDELGTSKGDGKELNILFEIINSRYEYNRPTVIISNQSIEDVRELLGQRIIDRLKEDGCRVLGMQWDSYRETNKSNF